jgi:hypothetical protein
MQTSSSSCTVFLSDLKELQALDEFADENVVLLMDNCPIHVTDEAIGLFRDAQVRLIIWALI